MKREKNDSLPNQWTMTTVGEICEIFSGFGFPKTLQGRKDGDLAFYKVGDISRTWLIGSKYLTRVDNYISTKEAEKLKAKPLPAGTTVFAKIGEAIKLNRRALLSKPSLVDNNVMGIYPDLQLIDPIYNFYYLNTIKLGDLSRATTVPSVRKSDVSDIPFPLAPIKEQKRIVEEIEKQFSRLDEAVAALKRIKANLKRYKASVLKAAVEGKLTKEWRKQHPNVETANELLKRILTERRRKWGKAELAKMSAKGKEPKDDKWKKKYSAPAMPNLGCLPILPKEWLWVTWEAILSFDKSAFKRGPFGSTLKKSIFVKSGYKVYEQYCPINDDCSFARYFITVMKRALSSQNFSKNSF